jgi:hypothetical protein
MKISVRFYEIYIFNYNHIDNGKSTTISDTCKLARFCISGNYVQKLIGEYIISTKLLVLLASPYKLKYTYEGE